MSCTASDTDWNSFIQFIRRAPTTLTPRYSMPTIVIGDFNARDPTWDLSLSQRHSNRAGRLLSDFLHSRNADDWQLLNISHQPSGPKPTRFSSVPGVEPSVIDLALCNDPNIVTSFETLTAHNILQSDHAPISVSFFVNPHIYKHIHLDKYGIHHVTTSHGTYSNHFWQQHYTHGDITGNLI